VVHGRCLLAEDAEVEEVEADLRAACVMVRQVHKRLARPTTSDSLS
jgi:hypothetical protein